MKKVLSIIACVAVLATVAIAQYTPETREQLNGVRISKATASASDLAIGANSLTLDFPLAVGDIIVDSLINTSVAMVSSNANATISLGSQQAADLLAATKLTNGFQAAGLDAGIPVGSAATSIILTAAVTAVNATVATGDVTNGTVTVYIYSID